MPDSSPQVSVIMPVCNREVLVGRAIRSILEQDFQDFEFIIIDDGSSDGTADVIRSFGDPRIQLALLPVNCGISMARNFGFRLARGEFLAMMDSDDVSLPQRLGKQLAWMHANPKTDILGCNAVLIAGEQRIVRPHSPDDSVIKARLLNLDGSAILDPTQMIRKAFLERTGLNYPLVPTDMDHGLWIEAMHRGGNFSVLQEYLFEYYRHDGNITFEGSDDYPDHLRRKTPMRARVLGLFFPGLTHEEAMAIAAWMENGRKASVMDASLALAAIRKAGTDARSFHGESKAEVGAILGEHARRALRALSQQGQPS